MAPELARLELQISAMPKLIAIDGVEHPLTQHLIAQLEPGDHEIVIYANGHANYVMQVSLAAGLSLKKVIELVPIRSGKKPPKPPRPPKGSGSGSGSGGDDDEGTVNPFDKKKGT